MYGIFILSSSDRRQQVLTTYLGPLKNCCPKFLHKFVCKKQSKTVQPAQPTSQSCQKNELLMNIWYTIDIFVMRLKINSCFVAFVLPSRQWVDIRVSKMKSLDGSKNVTK